MQNISSRRQSCSTLFHPAFLQCLKTAATYFTFLEEQAETGKV